MWASTPGLQHWGLAYAFSPCLPHAQLIWQCWIAVALSGPLATKPAHSQQVRLPSASLKSLDDPRIGVSHPHSEITRAGRFSRPGRADVVSGIPEVLGTAAC